MASSQPPLFANGQRIAGYEIVELVGRGGMGEVYRARQLSMDRQVALKILAPRLAQQDPSFAEKFVAEARAAGKLNHPNIVGVHDVGQAPAPEGLNGVAAGTAIHYFSMEFIEGESVKDIIERQGAMEAELVALVLLGISEALAYAEHHRIVHRDIKPDNILLANHRIPKLADLGLALHVGGSEEAVAERDGQGRAKVMGTPLYMSPEQAKALAVDHRSDQYSLGATLFHMLSGRPPFTGATAKDIMRSHCFDPVPDPAEANPQIPPPWRELCMRLMAKTPEERFTTTAELRAAIKAAARWKPGQKAGRRPASAVPWPAIAATAVVALGLLGWGWSYFSRHRQPPPAPEVRPAAPAPDPAASARARVDAELARLPADPAAALRVLERLLADPALAGERPRLERRAGEMRGAIEEQRRQPLRSALAAAEKDLEAGRLRAAAAGLSALPDEDWLRGPRQAAQERQRSLEQALDQRLGAAIDAATEVATLQKAAAEAATSELPDARRQALQTRAAARRTALVRTDPAPAKTPTPVPAKPREPAPVRWRAHAEQIEKLRGALPYNALQQACEQLSGDLPEDERAIAAGLAEAAQLATQVETALRLHIGQARPKVEARLGGRKGTFLITRLEKDWIGFRLPEVPAESRADRTGAVLPWFELLGLALTPKPDPRQVAAFLWYWRQPEAAAAAARLGEDPLAAAFAAYQRLARPWQVPGRLARVGDQAVAEYPFAAERDLEWIGAFTAKGLSLGGNGLRWTCEDLVQRGESKETDLPSLRWNAALQPPAELEATLRLDASCVVALAGFSSGDRTVRLGMFHTKRKFFTLATGENGDYKQFANTGAGGGTYNALEPVRVRIAVDEKGVVTLQGNGETITCDPPQQLPAGKPVMPLFQLRQLEKPASLDIQSLTLRGRP